MRVSKNLTFFVLILCLSYQSHYLSVSVSFPRNVRALALKCQNIPQKSQVHNCFSKNKNDFVKKLQFCCQERSIWLSLPISNVHTFNIPILNMYCNMFCNISMCIQCTFNEHSMSIQYVFNMYSMWILSSLSILWFVF